ncbi:MAG: 8-amino-7-oxononanoate synthase [Pseudomonadales bacterium]|nr:8-amino-7-oxononanoate synthase [Pseudomonadales bacterium]
MSDPFQIARRLQDKKAQHLYRQRRILESAQTTTIQCNGQSLLNFCSNDYLGLANHPLVIERFQQAANEYGVGSGASHLVIGHSALHHELEEQLAHWVGRPRALLFSTGYMANLGTVTALLQRGDSVIEDKLNHASLLDAARLSGAKRLRYHHNDVSHLQQRLLSASGNKLVVTDSVFSMDGDVAPLHDIAKACEEQNAWLMVDDAHGIGVLGSNPGAGKGVIAEQGLSSQQLPVYMATLGKAFGTFGAFVAGEEDLIEFLIQTARPYIYTTAMPPAVAAATLASVQLLQKESWRVEKLHQLIAYFRRRAETFSLALMPSRTAIQPLLIGDAQQALMVSQALQQHGILVGAIRPPTVPANTARLRITLSADHSEQQIDTLLQVLTETLHQQQIQQEF